MSSTPVRSRPTKNLSDTDFRAGGRIPVLRTHDPGIQPKIFPDQFPHHQNGGASTPVRSRPTKNLSDTDFHPSQRDGVPVFGDQPACLLRHGQQRHKQQLALPGDNPVPPVGGGDPLQLLPDAVIVPCTALRVAGGVADGIRTAGDGTGAELAADCPHATQAMADAILAQVRGCQYVRENFRLNSWVMGPQDGYSSSSSDSPRGENPCLINSLWAWT